MRCPYCGGINADQASYCVRCGRDLASQPAQYPPTQGRQPAQPQRPTQAQPQRPAQVQPTQGRQPVQPQRPTQAQPARGAPPYPYTPPPAAPPAPEPPAPFPPHTLAQLRALEPGALAYTVTNSAVGDGRKKIVQITCARAVAWQQAATLLKVLNEQQDERFNTIVIQGFSERDDRTYAFTHGQLTFDRNVLLGSQTMHRYLIETGNGLESDSVRIVLTEPAK